MIPACQRPCSQTRRLLNAIMRPGRPARPVLLWLLTLAGLLTAGLPAQAQSVCSSDGQRTAVGLHERFINANCADCWTAVDTPAARPGELSLDWVLPGNQGDDAPLSAVARRDGLERLQALGLLLPAEQSQRGARAAGPKGWRLRVAHGIAFNGYLGVSIEIKHSGALPPAKDLPLTGWLALVETLPAGTEGSPLERQLVRGLFKTDWDRRQPGAVLSRSMAVSEGVNPERLSLVGWLENARGGLLTAVQSRCRR
jgi:hypothetical protein